MLVLLSVAVTTQQHCSDLRHDSICVAIKEAGGYSINASVSAVPDPLIVVNPLPWQLGSHAGLTVHGRAACSLMVHLTAHLLFWKM